MEIFYAKRDIKGVLDADKHPVPDIILVTAFPSKANRDNYAMRTRAVRLEPDDPLVIEAKCRGLKDDYHSVSLPAETPPAEPPATPEPAPEEPAAELPDTGNEPNEPVIALPKPPKRKRGRPRRHKKSFGAAPQ